MTDTRRPSQVHPTSAAASRRQARALGAILGVLALGAIGAPAQAIDRVLTLAQIPLIPLVQSACAEAENLTDATRLERIRRSLAIALNHAEAEYNPLKAELQEARINEEAVLIVYNDVVAQTEHLRALQTAVLPAEQIAHLREALVSSERILADSKAGWERARDNLEDVTLRFLESEYHWTVLKKTHETAIACVDKRLALIKGLRPSPIGIAFCDTNIHASWEPGKNYSMIMQVSSGHRCEREFAPVGDVMISGRAGLVIDPMPRNGTVTRNDLFTVAYQSKPDFRGSDSFALRFTARPRGRREFVTTVFTVSVIVK
jgi:hypothetical protein